VSLAETPARRPSRLGLFVAEFLRVPSAAIALAVFAAMSLAALLAPWIAPQDPYDLASVSILDSGRNGTFDIGLLVLIPLLGPFNQLAQFPLWQASSRAKEVGHCLGLLSDYVAQFRVHLSRKGQKLVWIVIEQLGHLLDLGSRRGRVVPRFHLADERGAQANGLGELAKGERGIGLLLLLPKASNQLPKSRIAWHGFISPAAISHSLLYVKVHTTARIFN